MPKVKAYHLETELIHAGEPDPMIDGSVIMPIFQSAMFEFTGEKKGERLRYIRLNNTPNHDVLHRKLAILENGESALVAASGMAAISASLLSVLSAGDHLLIQDCLYGGTHEFVAKNLPRFGISHSFINGNDPDSWRSLVRPKTRAIYMESMTNPLLQVADLKGVVRFAKARNLVSMIDNTLTSPVNFRPLDLGFDLSIHSGTKYLNGHSDIVAGAVVGKAKLIDKISALLIHLGGSLDPHAAYLLHRGMKTLALRVNWQNESALKIARFFEKHPAVEKVYYPALKSHPDFKQGRALFIGFGGVLSLELKGGVKASNQFVRSVRLPVRAPSLGGVESLITQPSKTSHAGTMPQVRRKLGISDHLIRISVGLEATKDLMEDFNRALKTQNGK